MVALGLEEMTSQGCEWSQRARMPHTVETFCAEKDNNCSEGSPRAIYVPGDATSGPAVQRVAMG